MKGYLRSCFLLLLSFSTGLFAEQADPNANYWQCTARDGTNKQWAANSFYQKVALNFALAYCKQQSMVPASCRAVGGNCARFINGFNITPMWQCTALDGFATPWRSNLYSDREDAALAAKAYCRQNSTVPETCYVFTSICDNKNGFSR
jgi:hypothetical protein